MKLKIKIIFIICLLINCSFTSNYVKISYYGNNFHGKKTASGEIYDKNKLTAAHKTLPFNTKIKITYNNNNVIVRVNDRGPYVKGRELDISYQAMKNLQGIEKGVINAQYEILK